MCDAASTSQTNFKYPVLEPIMCDRASPKPLITSDDVDNNELSSGSSPMDPESEEYNSHGGGCHSGSGSDDELSKSSIPSSPSPPLQSESSHSELHHELDVDVMSISSDFSSFSSSEGGFDKENLDPPHHGHDKSQFGGHGAATRGASTAKTPQMSRAASTTAAAAPNSGVASTTTMGRHPFSIEHATKQSGRGCGKGKDKKQAPL
jgi:hypothetical protein